MSPRTAGEADKFGNRYEGRWTVGKFLEVLAGRATSIVLEERGEGGQGVEFTIVRNNGRVESHQVKRQRGNANSWSLRNLAKEDVLTHAARQVRMGRRFFFVSLVPCRALDELADQARRSDATAPPAFFEHAAALTSTEPTSPPPNTTTCRSSSTA